MPMKSFRFQFSKLIFWLLIAALALCAAAFALNAWRFFTFGADGFYDALQYIILLAATLACPIIIIPMLASSRYIVTEKELITKFGLIKSKYRLDDVMRLSLDRSTGKLSLYFKNDSFMIIVVNREWNDEFIEALREHHPASTGEYVENES